jgi:hypothetical protein
MRSKRPPITTVIQLEAYAGLTELAAKMGIHTEELFSRALAEYLTAKPEGIATAALIEMKAWLGPPFREIRGQRVILDKDLAAIYRVRLDTLLAAVHRNKSRFQKDFVVRLTRREIAGLTLGGRTGPVHAFSYLGAAMLAFVLQTDCAVRVSVGFVRRLVKEQR